MEGNTINVQGSYIDIHDNEVVNLSVDKGEVHITENTKTTSPKPEKSENTLPQVLTTPDAQGLWKKLQEAGLMKKDYQKAEGVSWAEAAEIAMQMAGRMGINNVWQTFGTLWNQKPEHLRQYYNRLQVSVKYDDFHQKIKELLNS